MGIPGEGLRELRQYDQELREVLSGTGDSHPPQGNVRAGWFQGPVRAVQGRAEDVAHRHHRARSQQEDAYHERPGSSAERGQHGSNSFNPQG